MRTKAKNYNLSAALKTMAVPSLLFISALMLAIVPKMCASLGRPGLGLIITGLVLGAGLLWFGISFLRQARRARHANRNAQGICTQCGYDRDGLGKVAPCPECGTVPSPGQ